MRMAIVRWFSPAAEQILGVAAADVLSRPVETIGSQLGSIMRETLDAKTNLRRTAMGRSSHAAFAFWWRRAG